MNEYWSNEDDGKVSYITQQTPRNSRAGNGSSAPDSQAADERRADEETGAFSYNQQLNRREDYESGQPAYTPNYGSDRSSFISGEPGERQRGGMQFAPPPKFSKKPQEPVGMQPDSFTYADEGYQVRSENPQAPGSGRQRKHGWRIALIILLVLVLIGGGAYLFRHQILELVGNIFGEETVWKIMPTAAPTEVVSDVPAYVSSTALQIKSKAMQDIDAVTGTLGLNADTVTEQSVVLAAENPDGTSDYYLFAYDTGRLLGYYEALDGFTACTKDIFYINREPYLVTSLGYPLVDPDAFKRSAGDDVRIRAMINGWAMVSDSNGTLFNYVGTDGELISDLWFVKAFPFTADTTLAYLDTGNVTAGEERYALYLLTADGVTERLSYVDAIDDVLESVCGMAFMQNGDMHMQDRELTLLYNTDDVSAYVNCNALVVRDPETHLYGLFVDGVQQYPFEFDEIRPMPSELVWDEYENGYVKRYAVEGLTYPLPRSYSFYLRRGETQQVVSIAAASVYPIVFD